LTTFVIGPADYGLFALVSAITGMGLAIAPMGSSHIMAGYFLTSDEGERRVLLSTIFWMGLLVLGAFTLVILGLWFPWLRQNPVVHGVSTLAVVLSVISTVLSYPWIVAMDVLTLKKEAQTFARVSIAQSIGSTIAVLLGLYFFRWGVLSLFVGVFVGAAIAFAGSLWVLKPYLKVAIGRSWAKLLLTVGWTSSAGSLLEVFQMNLERITISYFHGMAQLGLYTHAIRYRDIMGVPISAVGRAVWPMTLQEAKNMGSHFERSTPAWHSAHFLIIAAGIFFATLGDRVIALLTHDKFTTAYLYATAWMVFLLVQYSGRVQVTIVQAFGEAVYYSRALTLSTLLSMLLLVILVPPMGPWGAIAAMLLNQIVFRSLLRRRARALRSYPPQDKWVWVGIIIIPAVAFLHHLVQFQLWQAVALLLVLWAGLAAAGRREIAAVLQELRESSRNSRPT
jgi:O-antigen/teichoic acid export membrane protein